MRVIAGEFRSRVLKTLNGMDVRPTPDRLRESLFSVLMPRIAGSTFVDAYAGSGAVGIEALSRGAARAVFLEKNREAALLIRANLASLGITNRAEVVMGSAAQKLSRYPGDIVFLDPPYPQVREYDISLDELGKDPQGLVIAQHATRHTLEDRYGHLVRYRTLRQGDNTLSFYKPDRPAESPEKIERT
jgi:16S rRNA (guanine(966)-N(2))-methyltransferase RsmD